MDKFGNFTKYNIHYMQNFYHALGNGRKFNHLSKFTKNMKGRAYIITNLDMIITIFNLKSI